jgi:hypothetical protein
MSVQFPSTQYTGRIQNGRNGCVNAVQLSVSRSESLGNVVQFRKHYVAYLVTYEQYFPKDPKQFLIFLILMKVAV